MMADMEGSRSNNSSGIVGLENPLYVDDKPGSANSGQAAKIKEAEVCTIIIIMHVDVISWALILFVLIQVLHGPTLLARVATSSYCSGSFYGNIKYISQKQGSLLQLSLLLSMSPMIWPLSHLTLEMK